MVLWKYRNERYYVTIINSKYMKKTDHILFSRMEDMEKTDFFGVSGAVKFDKLGNRMSKVVVEQLRSKFLRFMCTKKSKYL